MKVICYNMKKKPILKCLNCGKELTPVKDPMTGKYTGYLWRAKCCKSGAIISIG